VSESVRLDNSEQWLMAMNKVKRVCEHELNLFASDKGIGSVDFFCMHVYMNEGTAVTGAFMPQTVDV